MKRVLLSGTFVANVLVDETDTPDVASAIRNWLEGVLVDAVRQESGGTDTLKVDVTTVQVEDTDELA